MNIMKILAVLVVCLGCSAGRVDDIKAHARDALDKQGFEIVGYQGYEWSGFGTWGGQVSYHAVRKDDKDKKLYSLILTKWGDEYHIYSLRCLEAISGR